MPCPPPGDLPNPGIKPESLTSPTLAGRFFTTSTPWEALIGYAAAPCCSVMSNSLPPHSYSPPGSSVHGDSLGKNTGVGCHALLQAIFPTQGSNPGSHIAGGFFTG